MFHLMQKRRLYYLLSAILIIPGLIAMIYSSIAFGAPLKLSIDFTGGSLLELRFENLVSLDDVRTLLLNSGLEEATVQTVGNEKNIVIRTKQIDVATKQALEDRLSDKFGQVTELRFESVGPTIGRETMRAAILAIIAAAAATLFFIAVGKAPPGCLNSM